MNEQRVAKAERECVQQQSCERIWQRAACEEPFLERAENRVSKAVGDGNDNGEKAKSKGENSDKRLTSGGLAGSLLGTSHRIERCRPVTVS